MSLKKTLKPLHFTIQKLAEDYLNTSRQNLNQLLHKPVVSFKNISRIKKALEAYRNKVDIAIKQLELITAQMLKDEVFYYDYDMKRTKSLTTELKMYQKQLEESVDIPLDDDDDDY